MVKSTNAFKGRQFTAEVILWAVRWYLQFPVSFRDGERMLADRGVSVDHTTVSEAGDKLFTFARFPKSQWKSIRTSNAIERLHEEFKRRIKTKGFSWAINVVAQQSGFLVRIWSKLPLPFPVHLFSFFAGHL
jgi:transposase-like protein